MTESLFLLTTVMTLFYIRTHKWILAGITGAFATFTRMVGLVLLVVAVVEFVVHYKVFIRIKCREWAEVFQLIGKKGVWILLMLLGSATYLYINWQITGDPFRFLYYQRTHWHQGFWYFGGVMISQFEHLAHSNRILVGTVFIPNLFAFTLTILLLLYASIKRLNLTHIVYLLGYTFVSFSLSWLLSGARYMVAAAPLFIFLAYFIEKQPPFHILVPLLFLVGLLVTMRWYVLGMPVF